HPHLNSAGTRQRNSAHTYMQTKHTINVCVCVCVFFFFKTVSGSIGQASPKFLILLSQLPNSWDYRYMSLAWLFLKQHGRSNFRFLLKRDACMMHTYIHTH
ncbi:mCG145545, partial [Mus musculus]